MGLEFDNGRVDVDEPWVREATSPRLSSRLARAVTRWWRRIARRIGIGTSREEQGWD